MEYEARNKRGGHISATLICVDMFSSLALTTTTSETGVSLEHEDRVALRAEPPEEVAVAVAARDGYTIRGSCNKIIKLATKRGGRYCCVQLPTLTTTNSDTGVSLEHEDLR